MDTPGKQTLTYIKNFIKDRNVASVTPSSPFLVKRVCRRMDFSERRVIVEYGPGTGVFSEYILERMGPSDRLILIETNRTFVNKLKKSLGRDPRVEVVHDSAERVLDILEEVGEPAANYVLSGIPFSFLSDEARADLIQKTRRALTPDGKFLVYQHYNHMEKPLRRHFERVETDFELLNLPPIRIQSAMKS